MTDRLDAGVYPGGQNNLQMQAVGSEHVVEAFEQAGLDTALPRALATLFARAVAAGHSADGLASLVEMVRIRG
ncbi:hypothetical protein AB0I34_02010 [Kribbella sp. NPDC050281]|uniref:imine reductase family protein n=1 Tax=Kribbella sp. NPDC050281 TaxID=3155515 RepID=UPI0033D46ECB